jgi:hypothetical protein
MIDLKDPPKKKKKKKMAREDNKVLMMRFESKRDSLPRERIDDGARDNGASRAAHPHVQRERRKRRERRMAGAERKPPKYYTNTRIKIRTYTIKVLA